MNTRFFCIDFRFPSKSSDFCHKFILFLDIKQKTYKIQDKLSVKRETFRHRRCRRCSFFLTLFIQHQLQRDIAYPVRLVRAPYRVLLLLRHNAISEEQRHETLLQCHSAVAAQCHSAIGEEQDSGHIWLQYTRCHTITIDCCKVITGSLRNLSTD